MKLLAARLKRRRAFPTAFFLPCIAALELDGLALEEI
jgi:hypothetical protein